MKKYKLLQWYPDTPSYMRAGFIIDYYYEDEKAIYTYPSGMRVAFYLPPHHLECRNFWELIEEKKKPLFTTEDGVEVFDVNVPLFIVDKKTHKKDFAYSQFKNIRLYHIFAQEANADEYILNNKRLFTYEEMKKANIDINWCTADIYNKAKERI